MTNTTNNTKTVRFPIKQFDPSIKSRDNYNPDERQFETFTKVYGEHEYLFAVDEHDMLSSPVSIIDFKYFNGHANIYFKFFGEEVVKNCLKYIGMRDLVGKETYVEETALYYARVGGQGRGIIVEPLKRITIKEWRGSWEREVEKRGYTIYAPNRYSSVYESKLIKHCILEKFPFMHDFKFDCYSFNYSSDEGQEFYVKVTEGDKTLTLYVPYKALVNKTRKPIITRMKSYFGPKSEDVKALEYEESLRFFEALENPETYVCKNHEEPIEYEIQERYKQYKYILMTASETEVYESEVFDTFTQAYETLEAVIENAVKAEAPSVFIDKTVKTGCAMAGVTYKNGNVMNYRISRIDVSRKF